MIKYTIPDNEIYERIRTTVDKNGRVSIGRKYAGTEMIIYAVKI